MVDFVENTGPILGLIAFGLLIVLLLGLFYQGRELRRLRDWAGRAPERAFAAAERDDEVRGDGYTGRSYRRALGEARTEPLRFQIDPLLIGAGAAAILLVVALLTGGFGLVGDGKDAANPSKPGKDGGKPGPDMVEVAILNGTTVNGISGVPGLADFVAGQVTEAGFKKGEIGNTAETFAMSEVLYADDRAIADADEVADALLPTLGTTVTRPMTSEVSTLAGGATVAVVVGLDDDGIVNGATLP